MNNLNEWFNTPIITIQVSEIIECIGIFIIIYGYMKTRKYKSFKKDLINYGILIFALTLIMISQ